MTGNEILKADMLDILFDNRNKQYGAYTLRKFYNQRLALSLGITFSAFLLLFTIIKPNRNSVIISKPESVVKLTSLEIPKDKLKIPDPPKPQKNTAIARPAAQKKLTTIAIVKNTAETVTETTEFDDAVVGKQNVAGPFTGVILPRTPIVPGTGTGTEQQVQHQEEALIQKEPEFPGGMEAWLNFLRRYLTPPTDLEPGEKKTVMVRFTVDADGSVNGFEVMQSAGRLYDNEVIRVLKKMPKWKPAIQNNHAVPRLFTQPVTFAGTEEQ